MSSWIIQTMEYDVDLEGLLGARLREGGAPYALSSALGGVGVRMEGRQGLLAWIGRTGSGSWRTRWRRPAGGRI